MSNDIVTRLREMWGHDDRCLWCEKHMDSQSGPHRTVCDLMEAADEIERLRAERIRWERIAHDLYRRVDVYGEICCCNNYDKHWCGLHAYDDEIKGLKERGKA